MRELFAFAERPALSEFVGFIMQNPDTQGVTVDVDRLWLALAQAKDRLPSVTFESLNDRVYESIVHGYSPYWDITRFSSGHLLPGSPLPNEPLDWKWLPPWWEDYCKRLDRPITKDPMVVRVGMLPWSANQHELPKGNFPFPVIFERRPQARLCSTKTLKNPVLGGVSIGVQSHCSGTLGGIVEDQKGKRYGLTCAHVATKGDRVDQPAQNDSPLARNIGNVIADSGLLPSTKSTPCNPDNKLSILNTVDAALIALDSSIQSDLKILTLGKVNRVLPANELNPGDKLYFVGKESGPQMRELIVGGMNVVYRFSDDGVKFFSFEKTFQIEWPNVQTPAAGSPVDQGDSGAWLCKPDGHSYAWAGMIFGSHRDLGYALFSEPLVNWIDQNIPNKPGKVC